jgi:hypothetical protein
MPVEVWLLGDGPSVALPALVGLQELPQRFRIMGCRHNPTVFDGNETSFIKSIAPDEADAEDDVFGIEAFGPGAFASGLYMSSNHERNG